MPAGMVGPGNRPQDGAGMAVGVMARAVGSRGRNGVGVDSLADGMMTRPSFSSGFAEFSPPANGNIGLDVSEHAIRSKIKKAIDRKRFGCMDCEVDSEMLFPVGLKLLCNHNATDRISVPYG